MKKTLVILAAGMGSRFGGLKQMTPVDKNGDFIIDYSIYDALRAGFDKVVFVIRKSMLEDFKNTIGKRIEDKIEVSYVFQEIDDLLDTYPDLEKREKPLGTVHALLAAKNEVNTPFIIINADDFYGKDAYLKANDFFYANNDENIINMVVYPINQVCSDNGTVKRGIVFSNEENYLENIKECVVEKNNDSYQAKELYTEEELVVDKDTSTSMNFFCFYPNIFNLLDQYMQEFLKSLENRTSKEALLPNALLEFIKEGKIKAKISKTTGPWIGMTYKEDQVILEEKIANLITKGDYPEKLWD